MEKNKISELIFGRLKELGKTKREMVADMGYKNQTKAYRRLSDLIEDFKAHDLFITQCAKSLQIEKEQLLGVIQEEIDIERKKEEAYERKIFKPYISSMMEHEFPTSIFTGCMMFANRFVYFEKDILSLQLDKQLKIVKKDILKHYKKNEGGIPAFGKILHYVFRRDYDEKEEDIILLTTEGNRIINPDENLKRIITAKPAGIRIR